MNPHRISTDEALARLADFDTCIDARSESEFALDHLPGAQNWPSLTDAQHHELGTLYKQVSPFHARKHGAALVARNIAQHIERHVLERERDWAPLIYCRRGGQRSGALALVLAQIGFRVSVLEGGYQALRRSVLAQLVTRPATLHYRVVCGRTGSAKSRLLHALAAQGAQVLDLEALACHRGSVLGPLPGQAQPSQKAFETQVWHALHGFDPARPVFAEGESRTIGRLRVPEALLQQLRAAPCVQVHMPLAARVAFLLRDYAHFVSDTESFCARLEALVELRGADVVRRWQGAARGNAPGALAGVVQELLELHYDPIYLKSMQRNFAGFAQAATLELASGDDPTLAAAARRLLAATDCAEPATAPGPLAN